MKILRILTVPSMLAAVALFAGCEVDTPTDVQRNVGVNFTGFYQSDQTVTGPSTTNIVGSGTNTTTNVTAGATTKGAIVRLNTGNPITSLDLRQGGDRLEAIDNNGIIFKGSIGDFNGTVASFELVGRTTAGNKATISGTLTVAGGGSGSSTGSVGSTDGTMKGTWIEDTLFSVVFATASIPGVSAGGGGGGGGGGSFQITANPQSVGIGGQSQLTASGGTGTITWSNPSHGSLSSTQGPTVTYTRNASGQDVITASDSIGRSDSITIN